MDMPPNLRLAKRRKLVHPSPESEESQEHSHPQIDTSDQDDLGSDLNFGEPGSGPLSVPMSNPVPPNGSANGMLKHQQIQPPMATTATGRWHVLEMLTKELLSQLRPNYDLQRTRHKSAIDNIFKAIYDIPAHDPMPLLEAEDFLRTTYGVEIPFATPKPGKDTKYRFGYSKPTSIEWTGPAAFDLYLKGSKILALAVAMPSKLLEKKDFLNYRAFHKRAYYLACIAAELQPTLGKTFDLNYEYYDDVQFFPILKLIPKTTQSGLSLRHQIEINVTFPQDAFPLEKVQPHRNCVRWDNATSAESGLEPTPFYNSCINALSSVEIYQNVVSEAVSNCRGFADACRLGQVWLRQRDCGPSISSGGFGGFEWILVCALLLQKGGPKGRPQFSSKFSALSLFRAMLQFIATSDLTKPFVLGSHSLQILTSDHPFFFDPSSGLNILYKMTPWSYQKLQMEAQRSLQILKPENDEVAFDFLFIEHSPAPLLQFHETFKLDASNLELALHSDSTKYASPSLVQMHRILSKGFGNRAKLVVLSELTQSSFKISQRHPKNAAKRGATVHLLLDPSNADRLVDRGPFDGDKEQAEFRSFWGDKAELRRFKDNAVARESLVWSEGPSIRLQILQYLFQHHFQIPKDGEIELSTNLEQVHLCDDSSTKSSEYFKTVSKTFQSLSNTLLNLSSLPLRIHSVQPASPQLNSSSTRTPLTSIVPSTPINAIIEFESSPNWPDSLPAIQYTKLAFLIKIADQLDTQHSDLNLVTRIGLENESKSTQGYLNTSFLDIIYPSPQPGKYSRVPFRIRIRQDREEHLIRTAQADKSIHGSLRDTLESALQLDKQTSLIPAHTVAIRNLCHQFPVLSPTVRLLKKWTAAHLLGSLIPEPVVDTLAASVVTDLQPLDPGPPALTFLKCLKKISRWNWQMEPLVAELKVASSPEDTDEHHSNTLLGMDTQQPLTAADRTDFQLRHQAWRDIDPARHRVAATIFTNIDKTGVVWTQMPKDPCAFFPPVGATPGDYSGFPWGLPAVALDRWQALATVSVEAIETKARSGELAERDWREIFRTPIQGYDFVLHLRRDQKTRKEKTPKFKNLAVSASLDSVTPGGGNNERDPGFDPLRSYVVDLYGLFGRACVFFYGDGAEFIGGLWRQREGTESMPFRVRGGLNVMPVAGGGEETAPSGMVQVNRTAILNEIARLGEGIVKSVEVLKADDGEE